MLEFKPDYEESKKRIDAFWEREIIDRPVVQFGMAKPEDQRVPLPESRHATPEERWLDAEYQAQYRLAALSNAEFLGDTMPVAMPNLGPEVFAAFYGCAVHFGDYGTSWTDPILEDWEQVDDLELDLDNFYWHKLGELTDAFLEVGEGKFITGMTDWHPGGDCLAALRDPVNLAMDLVTHSGDVVRLLEKVERDYFVAYDIYYRKLCDAGQPIATWLSLVSDEKWYVPSNDFSYMISSRMFDEIFLPGIRRECQFLTHSIYHLDGPGALSHLDSILSIPELNALQWVPGAGNRGFHQWVPVYQKAQAAGKGIQVFCDFGDIDEIMETLDPRGLYLSMGNVPSREAGLDMLDRLTRWCAPKTYSVNA